MAIRTRRSITSGHASDSSARCRANAAAAASLARVKAPKALSPSPLCLTSVPPCAATTSATIRSWRARARSISRVWASQSRVEPSTSVSMKVTVPLGRSASHISGSYDVRRPPPHRSDDGPTPRSTDPPIICVGFGVLNRGKCSLNWDDRCSLRIDRPSLSPRRRCSTMVPLCRVPGWCR